MYVLNLPKIRSTGFTLIELLLVIALIGVLSGILIAIISPSAQQDVAQDGVRTANLNKAISGLEAHRAVEGTYPLNTSAASLDPYIQTWPTGVPDGTTYDYSSDGNSFCVRVFLEKPLNGLGLKYCSDWGEVRECSNMALNSSVCN
ncbi:MAG: competence type IV pilus major pilin ComGC [Patescibacteria group bacterium]